MAVIFTKLNGFIENLANKEIDLGGAGLTVALSNTAPAAEATPPTGATSACVLANVTQVSYANLSSRVCTVTSCTQTSGTVKLILADLTLTATGAVGPYRYIYLYDDNSTGDMLIGYYDYGSENTMADTDTFKLDFDAAAGVLTIEAKV